MIPFFHTAARDPGGRVADVVPTSSQSVGGTRYLVCASLPSGGVKLFACLHRACYNIVILHKTTFVISIPKLIEQSKNYDAFSRE